MSKDDIELLSFSDDDELKYTCSIKNENKQKKKTVIVIIVLVLIVFLIAANVIYNKSKKEDNVKSIEKNVEKNVEKEIETNVIICSNSEKTFQGYEFDIQLEYNENNLDKYTFSFYIDRGRYFSDDDLWDIVNGYEDEMPWKPDMKGFAKDDNTNPYKYRFYYSLDADTYCKELEGCNDEQLYFDHRDDMIPDLEKQLDLKCFVK